MEEGTLLFGILLWACLFFPFVLMWAFVVTYLSIKSKREKEAAEEEKRQAQYLENSN
jgi:hypothetical protein